MKVSTRVRGNARLKTRGLSVWRPAWAVFAVLILGFVVMARPFVFGEEPKVTPSAKQGMTKPISLDSPQDDPARFQGKILSDVRTSIPSFDPSRNESVTVMFKLLKPARVSLQVYDPDWDHVSTLSTGEDPVVGEQSLTWNGKDADGNIVPDEAYFFTLVSEEGKDIGKVYDPTTFSGGVEHDITSVRIDPEDGTVSYVMPEMGRVMIRVGIEGGPLLNTLVDWSPRLKGEVFERWNGKDKDNISDITRHPGFKMIISYFTLPENSVITFGNKTVTYRGFKKLLTARRQKKPGERDPGQKLSAHYRLPRTVDYSPPVRMVFGDPSGSVAGDFSGGPAPTLKGKALVRVDLDEEDKKNFLNQQFEICFFLDHQFHAEDETGYAPFNWVWDLSNVEPGEHILTVNVTGFRDQIGLSSRKVVVAR